MSSENSNQGLGEVDAAPETEPDLTVEETATVSVSSVAGVGDREYRRGESVGRYVVLEPLGSGGMGVVLAAYDPELDRKVAIKLLHSGAPGSDGPDARLRLQREARAMAKLSHPNVVTVHDVGLFEDEVFIAMEFVRGTTLGDWRKEHPDASWREVVEKFLQAGAGMLAAHEKGLVHRDFKPANVLVASEGAVKVTDFGLARAARPLAEDEGIAAAGPTARTAPPSVVPSALRLRDDLLETPVTEEGAVVGTPAYLPPEAYGQDGLLDARSDQFAFCVALWDALLGAKPYGGPSYPAMLAAMAQGKIQEPPPDHGVPQSVLDVVRRGLRPLPEDRWNSMGELLDELRGQIEPRPRGPSRAKAAAWVSLPLAVVLAGLLWWNHRAHLCAGADSALDGVWNEERRQALRAAASAVEGPGTETFADRLLSAVESWASSWSDARVDACESTRLRGEQSESMLDLRMACLDRKLSEMDSFLGFLLAGEVPESAPSAAAEVARLALCSDAVALSAPIPPPEDQESLAQVESLRRRLDEAQARLLAGQPTVAAEEAKALEEAARELGYAPLVAETSEFVARTSIETGAYEAARDAAHRALSAAFEGRHEYYLARSMTHLMVLEGSVFGDFDASRRWRDHAASALERVGSTRPALEARLANGWGQALYIQSDLAGALESFRRAYELEVSIDGERTPDSLGLANNIVVITFALGRVQEAYDRLLEVRDRMESILGPRHPHLAFVLNNLAEAERALGRPDACIDYGQKALELSNEVFGRDQAPQVNPLHNLGFCLSQLGRYDEGLERHDQSLALATRLYGDSHPTVCVAFVGRAEALHGLGRSREALDEAGKAENIGAALSGDDGSVSDVTLAALHLRSRIQRDLGQPVAALASVQKALDLLRQAGREQTLAAGSLVTELGHAWTAAGETERARDAYESALALLRPDDEPSQDPRVEADANLGLAGALLDLDGDVERVEELLARAESFFDGRVGVQADEARKRIDELRSAIN